MEVGGVGVEHVKSTAILKGNITLALYHTLVLTANLSSAAAPELGNIRAEKVQCMQLGKRQICKNPGSALSLSPCLGLHCSEILCSWDWWGGPGQREAGGVCPCHSLPWHPFLETWAWAQTSFRTAHGQHKCSCLLLRAEPASSQSMFPASISGLLSPYWQMSLNVLLTIGWVFSLSWRSVISFLGGGGILSAVIYTA